MSSTQGPKPANNDFYLVIHVATTCDEHGVYVTKDSAEVIEIGWLLLESKTLDEVRLRASWVGGSVTTHTNSVTDSPRKYFSQACEHANYTFMQ